MIVILGCGKLYANTLFKDGWMYKSITENVDKLKAEIKSEEEQREINYSNEEND